MEDKFFKTHDFGLATALTTQGYPVAYLDKNNPQQVEFLFERGNGIDETVQAYWQSELKVNAQIFFQNSKLLKNRIYSN